MSFLSPGPLVVCFLTAAIGSLLTTTPVADNTSSEVGHGESWPENPWQTVKKKQYRKYLALAGVDHSCAAQ